MHDISPTSVILKLVELLVGASFASQIAPHLTVIACAAVGSFMGRERDGTSSRIGVLSYIIGMTFVSWLFTSLVLNAIHVWVPSDGIDDRLWMGPISWLIAFIGLRWRALLHRVIDSAHNFLPSKTLQRGKRK